MRQKIIDVLIVARAGDEHADLVASALEQKCAKVFRISLNLIRELGIEWRQDGSLRFFAGDNTEIDFSPNTTIWWRRPGWVEVDDLLKEEAEMIEAECSSILYGALLTQKARWVDHPDVIRRAENKLYQLFVAYSLGLEAPGTTVTNLKKVAAELTDRKRTIAKPVSSGPGLAPCAQEISRDLLGFVRSSPVLLQELVEAPVDLRVITIGNRVFTWERKRLSGEAIDWRVADPAGTGFYHISSRELLSQHALTVAKALGLSMSVQDWLCTEDKPLFLEVNPQGQWLFLRDAEPIIVPAVVEHLLNDVG